MADQEKQEAGIDTLDFNVVDKRQFVNLDSTDTSAPAVEKPRYPTYVEELMARMAETESKFQEKKKQIDDEIGRTKTRLENDFERRMELEKQKIILPFLEVLDNLQRALDSAAKTGTVEHLMEGVQMTASLFRAKLQAIGVEGIPALSQPFDPNLEQAIGTVRVSNADHDGIVVEEVQSGYCLNGLLLRPAQVRVGRFE
jgi:molecular chaperone GrpE